MEKIYKLQRLYIFLLFLLALFVTIILCLNYRDFYKKPVLFSLGVFGIVTLLFSLPSLLFTKIIIDSSHLLVLQYNPFLFFKKVSKQLEWDEVGYILDDYVQPILFYPPYKLHIFHIMPKDNIHKSFKRISISPGVKNYKDLLCEVVSRVGPDVKIDDYVYEFLDKYKINHGLGKGDGSIF